MGWRAILETTEEGEGLVMLVLTVEGKKTERALKEDREKCIKSHPSKEKWNNFMCLRLQFTISAG